MDYRQKHEQFLMQDQRQRMLEANEREDARKKEIELAKQRELEREAMTAEQKRLWSTFYDGKGFNMLMDFTWYFNHQYFVSPMDMDLKENCGYKYNYVWSNADYNNGDNTIRPFEGTMKDFFGNSYGRDKGKHIVLQYCGTKTKFVPN